jgi:hypothetical protein
MANLRDRGQIILVAAFALAVIFIALALIVNSAIFTENLASRGETSGSDGALSMRAMVETNAGENLESVNQQTGVSHGNLEDDMEDSVATISAQTGTQQARGGRLVTVDGPVDRTDGVRIYEDDPQDTLESGAGSSYTVAEDIERLPGANGTRAFRINVTDMSSTSDTSPLRIRAEDHGATSDFWEARIWENGDTVHVETERTGGSGPYECAVTPDNPSQAFEIDVTSGTIDDKPCAALRRVGTGEHLTFSSGAGDNYDISLENADLVFGELSLIAVNPGGTVDVPVLSNQDALYDVTLEYEYATSDLRYETDIRVAPGEPDA